jgi:acyl-coenzyme A synthetase/AMP-(fatty) acid ligase
MPEGVCPISRRFLALTRRDPGSAALLGGGGERSLSRSRLARAAAELAVEIRPLARSAGVVAVSLPNSAEMVRAFLAARLAGCAVALVDAAAPAEELRRCAEAVGACLVATTPGRLPGYATGDEFDGVGLVRLDVPPVALPPRTAVLKMTSGSTGVPRAIALTARQLVADTAQIISTMGLRPDDVTLAAIPMTHSYGLGSCLLPLLLAGTPIVVPATPLPAALAETIATSGVTHFPAVPAMVRTLATLANLPAFPRLRVCLTAGAPLSPRDAAAFHAATGRKVHVFYGSSECGGITYDRSDDPVHAEGAVGAAMDRVLVEVVDDAGRPLPAGASGRVRVTSRAVALAALPPHDEPGALEHGAFLTADLGVLDADGRLTLTGRVSEVLNVAGKKVHPDEVRRVIEALPGVRAAVVTGLPDPHRGELVAALVAVEPAAGVTVRALLQACRARLAPHKVPRRLVLVDELPLSDRGKLRRDAVLALLSGRSAEP